MSSRLKAIQVFVAAAFLSAPTLHAATIYVFTGVPYASAISPFTTSQSVNGTFTLNAPLVGNLSTFTLITPSAFSFFNGVTSFDQSNATSNFQVTTNSVGAVTGWQIDISLTANSAFCISTVGGPLAANTVAGSICNVNINTGLPNATRVGAPSNTQVAGTSPGGNQGSITLAAPEPSTITSVMLGLMLVAGAALYQSKKS